MIAGQTSKSIDLTVLTGAWRERRLAKDVSQVETHGRENGVIFW